MGDLRGKTQITLLSTLVLFTAIVNDRGRSIVMAPSRTDQPLCSLLRIAPRSANVIVMVFLSRLSLGGRPRTRWMTTVLPPLVNFMFIRLGPGSGAIRNLPVGQDLQSSKKHNRKGALAIAHGANPRANCSVDKTSFRL